MKNINIYQKTLLGAFLGLLVFWVGIQVSGVRNGNINYLYSFLFGLIPLIGGLIGIVKSSIWGRLSSSLGKSMFFISLGLIFWGFGETIWSYYNFFRHVAAPYPSLADIGFAPSIFFWVIGAAFLASASGASLMFKRRKAAKLFVGVAVLLLSALSYYMLVQVARGGVLVPDGETMLKVILDLAYPLGDFLAATFAFTVFVLSFKYFGGYYKNSVGAILAGLAVMYIGDFIFSYRTTVGTYYNADSGDLVLTAGLFLLAFGILGFATKPRLQVAPAADSDKSTET